MPGAKEIRNKIRSVKNTQKITKAMEMVAASKMRKAQDRMRKSRPFGERIRAVTARMRASTPEYAHPFLSAPATPAKRVGVVVMTSDKGLCGGLNTNVLRLVTAQMRQWSGAGVEIDIVAMGNKGLGFMQRLGANVISHVTGLGDAPHLDRLIGPVKILLDAYGQGRYDQVFIAYNRFVNTMKQEPTLEQLLPLSGERIGAPDGSWDYIYEPEPQSVVDEVMVRYVEALIFQSVAENMASEQSARMVAMKAASDNAGNVITELQLIYNKTRQAAITKELAEIVGGAAAV